MLNRGCRCPGQVTSLTIVPAHISGAVVGGLIHVNPEAIKLQVIIHALRNTCIELVVG